jgi:hypothetical protein
VQLHAINAKLGALDPTIPKHIHAMFTFDSVLATQAAVAWVRDIRGVRVSRLDAYLAARVAPGDQPAILEGITEHQRLTAERTPLDSRWTARALGACSSKSSGRR